MKKEEHMEISIKMFGDPGKLIHEFLDQFFGQYGPYHRFLLHNRKGIVLINQKFPGPARAIAEQHCLDDLGFIVDNPMSPEFTMDRDYADGWSKGNNYMAEIEQLYPDWRPNVLFHR